MIPISLENFKSLNFTPYEHNPVIVPFDGSPVTADPSILTPKESPDNMWHLFCHTTLGVYHFKSEDGISFKKVAKICGRAMRPNINVIDGRYYLFYEKTRSLIANGLNLFNLTEWESGIYVKESDNLNNWTKSRPVLTKANGLEKSERGTAVSNPFLLKINGKNRLYFSCGLTFIDDCGFCEPTHISYAESKEIDSGYIPAEKPIFSPDINDEYRNLCSGCLKVYQLSDCYIGIQNGLYERDGKSQSAILLFSSPDGTDFTFEKVLIEPGKEEWMAQYVYASHLVFNDNTLRLYFNARNNSGWLKGRECIGFYEAKILP